MSDKLLIEKKGNILYVTLNDPDTRNALNGEDMFAAFETMVSDANADMDVRAVIVTGAGSAFSSGGNVQDMREKKGMFGGTPHVIAEKYRTGIQRIPLAFMRLDVPAIAAVNGAAVGAGCDLACMCDIRVASEKAFFAESFVRVGIVAGDGGSWLLPRAIGYSRAAEMAFTGDRVHAEEALRIGLVSRVVAADKLMDAAREVAGRIAENPPHVLRWTKRLLRESQHERLPAILDMAATYQGMAHQMQDHAEAVAALIDKKTPVYKGV